MASWLRAFFGNVWLQPIRKLTAHRGDKQKSKHPARINKVTTAFLWATSLTVLNESRFSLTLVGLSGLVGAWLPSWTPDRGLTKMTRGLLTVKTSFWPFLAGCISDFWRLRIRYNIHPQEVMMKKRPRKRRIAHERNNIWAPKSENSSGMEHTVIVWSLLKAVNGINTIAKEQTHVRCYDDYPKSKHSFSSFWRIISG